MCFAKLPIYEEPVKIFFLLCENGITVNSYNPKFSCKMPQILLFLDLVILIDLLILGRIWINVMTDFRSRNFSQQIMEKY